MLQSEFENLTLRGNTHIPCVLYHEIEKFYVSDNDYARHVGADKETKQQFVRRVFGGKVNTPASVARKIAAESIRENRYLLRGCTVSETRFANMDDAIKSHYEFLSNYEF